MSRKHHDGTEQVRANHEPPSVVAIHQHSGQRGRQGPGQHLGDEHGPQRQWGARELGDEDVEGDGVEPVAEQRDDRPQPEPPDVAIAGDERPVAGLLVDFNVVRGTERGVDVTCGSIRPRPSGSPMRGAHRKNHKRSVGPGPRNGRGQLS